MSRWGRGGGGGWRSGWGSVRGRWGVLGGCLPGVGFLLFCWCFVLIEFEGQCLHSQAGNWHVLIIIT